MEFGAIAALLAALTVATIFGWAVIILTALFILVAALVALFGGDDPSTNAQPPTQEADPEGPTAGDTSEPAGSGTPPGSGGSPGADDAGGEPSGGNPGSPTGRNTVPFDLRVIDLINEAGASSRFPPDRLCEHPGWWDHAGRWGVRVAPSSGVQWNHGDRSIDEQGRSLAYWNSARLAAAIDAEE